MNPKSTILLLLSLATVAFSAAAPAEPNDAAPLRFEMNPDVVPWIIEADATTYRNPGSIRPQYVARIILPRAAAPRNPGEIMKLAMSSPLAQTCSQAQKAFLDQGFGMRVYTSAANPPLHFFVYLYAVSEADARIMARALIDAFAARARRSVANERNILRECQERLTQNQAALPEKEKQLEQAQKHYDIAKSNTYPLSDDGEARKLARELTLQMDRQAKTLDIDQAGLRGKLEVIDAYLSRPDLTNDIVETLEAQRIELLIELSGLEARRKAIRRIREEQHRFCTLFDAWDELGGSVREMRKALKQDEDVVNRITARLENPSGYLVPPKVYENKVILHPIEPLHVSN